MKKILFVQDGGLSFVNRRVIGLIEEHFGKDIVEVFDIKTRIKRRKRFFFINFFFFVWEYRLDILLGRKNLAAFKSTLFITSYTYRLVKSAIARQATRCDYLFTFQTQSQYDASVPGIPHYVYTDHTLRANFLYPNINYHYYLKPNWYLLRAEKRVYHRASVTFTYSQNIHDSVVQQYDLPTRRVAVVGVGCHLEPPAVINEKKYHSKNILFVGIDWNRKGGDLLLDAFRKVIDRIADAHLTIVGCSPSVSSLSNTTVVGRVPLDEVAKFYQNAAVFCMPSRREPFGLVYLEAMLYQLPVVGLKTGALPELITNEHNGYLVPDNANTLAERLSQLIEQPSVCRRMGQRGAKVVETNYQWTQVGQRIARHIQTDLTERSAVLNPLTAVN